MTGKKVLLVDDEPMIRDTLAKHLTERGAIVEVQSSFEDGLAALKKNMPDAVVLDVMMGGRSGVDLAKEIHKMPPPHPYVMILTNSLNADYIADGIEAGVANFVQKAEHDPAEIVDMIARKLGGTSNL
jgi:DNA-binding response OmpR family regulator